MKNIILFKAEDSFQIQGRGLVLTGPCPIDIYKISDIVGKKIQTPNSRTFKVKGVERFAIPGEVCQKGNAIGFLVEELDE